MPSFAEHPAEVVTIPIGAREYKFRLTLGSLRRFSERDDVDTSGVAADVEEAKAQAEEVRRTGQIDGLVDTLWIARQPYKQPGDTKEAMEDAIKPSDFGAVLAGYAELMGAQMDAGDLKEAAENASREAESTKKKTASNTSAASKPS